jgi:hypothetical protein
MRQNVKDVSDESMVRLILHINVRFRYWGTRRHLDCSVGKSFADRKCRNELVMMRRCNSRDSDTLD